ncbi:MAG: hypothetical protein M9962_06390 [Oligoflexia bacterium]|nr:hypothetical protein [Oligoflexia bacterium]
MKNIRRQILINPNFQLRFAILFSLAVLVYTAIFPMFVITVFQSMKKLSYIEKNPAIFQAINEAKYDIFIFCILMFFVVLFSSFFLALFHSHKIAGPLYKLRLAMISMQQGVLDRHISFRNKDNFPELASGFNAMTDAIFIRRRREFENLRTVIPKLETLCKTLTGEEKALATEALSALKEISFQDTPNK